MHRLIPSYLSCYLQTLSFNNDHNEPEEVHMRISTDLQGQLLNTNQVHNYIYRADSLADMNFYDFCRCMRVESIGRTAKIKNTYETRLGVLHRHQLKAEHPSAETHVLVEHTNEARGDGDAEIVPRIIGMSIPHKTNVKLWAIFCLAHFKLFSILRALIAEAADPVEVYERWPFGSRSVDIMANWEAVHKCEDERDADRLRKHAQLTTESKALTSSVGLGAEDNELDFCEPAIPSRQAESDFRVQQAVLELQQAGWFDVAHVNQAGASPVVNLPTNGRDISVNIKH
ncbi:hypothetical protein EV702DRAFT_1244556 [Suillus placidus]|uniref:Uncharacterized protein n=1 Tax=Suillus placidus TaxID=48579 RepID=A0A9P7A2U5_9AGAM|nr:hypothetical protein EV702DRAFT_1244556 [Suillus placidus]